MRTRLTTVGISFGNLKTFQVVFTSGCRNNNNAVAMCLSPYTACHRNVSFLSSSSVLLSRRFDAVYVINLDRRPDRWAFIKRQLQHAGFSDGDYERFPAINGNDIDANKARACGLISFLGLLRLQESDVRRIWGMDLNSGALGCAFSHMLLWATIAARRYNHVLVVEDDSLFPRDFYRKYLERMRHVPKDWELLYVSGLDTAGQAPLLRVAEGVSRVPQLHRTTNCYVISHQGARRLLGLCFPITYQLDTMMTMRVVGDKCGGTPYVGLPVCYTLQPPLVVQATRMGSDIQSLSGGDMHEEELARCLAAGWSLDEIAR